MSDPSHTPMPGVLVLRDPRESWKRCSLRPLRGRHDFEFVTWHETLQLEAGQRVLLDPDGEPLTAADAGRGLFVIDCSWRRLPRISRAVVDVPPRRALPPLITAYPRRSTTFADPRAGLASVEALYAASLLLGRPDPSLLEGYRFARAFLDANPSLQPFGR